MCLLARVGLVTPAAKEAGVRAPSWDGGRPIPPNPFHNSSQGSSHVPLGKGWFGDPRRQRGCWEEGAGHEDGGGAEEGEESAMDGVVGGPRVGKERQLPHNVLKIVPIKYMISYFVFSIP